MGRRNLLTVFFLTGILLNGTSMMAQNDFEHDTIMTDKGQVELWFLGHGTLMLKYNDMVIHVDPFSAVADYSKLPEADMILITHQHGDHLDPAALAKIKGAKTIVFCNELSAASLPGATVMKNGDRQMFRDIEIDAVPAYNIVNKRPDGTPFHPRGEGNGYILTIGDKRIYIAGDTEDIPEMEKLGKIYVAFLPMNLPYTMTPEMVASAARMFNPAILYPYHYGETDAELLLPLVDSTITKVRIRKLK